VGSEPGKFKGIMYPTLMVGGVDHSSMSQPRRADPLHTQQYQLPFAAVKTTARMAVALMILPLKKGNIFSTSSVSATEESSTQSSPIVIDDNDDLGIVGNSDSTFSAVHSPIHG